MADDKKNWRHGNKNAAKPESEKKSAHLYIEVTPAQKNQVVRAAQSEGMTLGAWVRRLIDRELRKQ